MLSPDHCRFLPARVQLLSESGYDTEIRAGLAEGEKVVASLQFLIDSEASLSGVESRPIGAATPTAAAKPAATGTLYETVGKIEQITANSVTLSHEPVPAIVWPAMTMTFQLPDPKIPRGLKTGDRVRRSVERRVGKECVSSCRCRLSPYPSNKNIYKPIMKYK